MLKQELNELVTHVGPGTPGGEFLRRYWWPVGLSQDIKAGAQPQQVRVLGEDLVLFRDQAGTPGLIGLHCSHRLVSLAYGRVEDGGIRCPMHGWLYDVTGRCRETPAEPDDAFKDHFRHKAYPCQELGGLIFAYLGPPEQQPLLPRYEALVRTDGTRWVSWYPINGGWLQHLEGAWDTVHAQYLHMNHWSVEKHKLATLPKPKIDFVETDYGLWQRGDKPHPNGEPGLIYTYFVMPAGFLRLGGTYSAAETQKFHSWYTPVDDGHTRRFQVAFASLNRDGSPYQWRPDGQVMQPGADQDYGRDYEHVDSISGIDPSTPSHFRAQDTMANETQGFPVIDRTQEHLGAHDQVVMAMRLMILKGIADVEKGLDPKHVVRDPAHNETIYIRGNDALEFFTAERDALGVG